MTFQFAKFCPTLYHGTSSAALHAMVREGIKPRGAKREGNWTHSVQSNPDRLYLTDAYPLFFAFSASQEQESGALLEIDTRLLDEKKFISDEDALEQACRKSPYAVDGVPAKLAGWDAKRRTIWFREHASDFRAEVSLMLLGTIAYRGVVPWRAVKRVCAIEPHSLLEMSLRFDPFISIANYQLFKSHYRAATQWFFDGSTVVHSIFDGEPMVLPRAGISVQEGLSVFKEQRIA